MLPLLLKKIKFVILIVFKNFFIVTIFNLLISTFCGIIRLNVPSATTSLYALPHQQKAIKEGKKIKLYAKSNKY